MTVVADWRAMIMEIINIESFGLPVLLLVTRRNASQVLLGKCHETRNYVLETRTLGLFW